MGHYPHFILAMRRSRGFASTAPNQRPFRTRFRLGSAAERLNRTGDGKSPDHYAKGTPSPWGYPRRALTACRRMVSGSLSSPLGVLLIFRSRYWCAIGRQRVLSLAGWAPRIQARFRVTGPTQVPDGPL